MTYILICDVRAIVTYVEKFPDAYIERAHPFQQNFCPPRESDSDPYKHYWYVGLMFDKDKLKADGRKAPNVAEPVKMFKNRLLGWKNRLQSPHCEAMLLAVPPPSLPPSLPPSPSPPLSLIRWCGTGQVDQAQGLTRAREEQDGRGGEGGEHRAATADRATEDRSR
jgi:hypothetical protein